MTNKIDHIYVDDGGAGAVPIIFLHSLAGNTQHWSAQLSHVRKTRRAIALDLQGHGRSSSPANGDYAIHSMAQDVQVVIDQFGIEDFILVGHSMGGSVAGAIAGDSPQKVAGLLLVDPAGDSTQIPIAEVQQFLGALDSDAYIDVIEDYWTQLLTDSTESTRTQVMQDLHNMPKSTVVAIFRELIKHNPIPAVNRYSGPTLSLITPLNETPFSLHRIVPDLSHELITGTSHWIQLDRPEEFNRILDKFLVSIEDDNMQK